VVGDAPAEQPPVAFDGLERRAVPLLERLHRLDVVVTVDQHDWGGRVGGRPFGVHRGQPAGVQDLGHREPGPAPVPGQPRGPVPLLKVAYMVAAGTSPADAIRAKISGAGGSASRVYDTSAASRARLSRPPPEMCASPRGVTPAAHSASAARTYTRVGASSASA